MDGMTCQKMTNDNYVDCVAPCSNSFVEYTDCQNKDIAHHFCEDTASGGKYEFIITSKTCANYCVGGQCSDNPPPTEGTPCNVAEFSPQCQGTESYNCIDNIITKTTCASGTTCAIQFGSNVAECVPSCNNIRDDVYQCITDGNITKTNNKVCRLGTDSRLHLFTESITCESFCNNGVCDIANIPNHGDTCDPTEFQDFCYHNTSYYCNYVTNSVIANSCTAGTPICRYREDKEFADCVAPCEEGTEPLKDCRTEGDIKYLDTIECVKGSDGSYYLFTSQETCPNGCKSGKCL